MSELRERLDEALRAVNPGDPPVQEAIRRGKAIRTRRRAGVVAAVAAVAVLAGAGYPALTHRQAAPGPVTPAHKHVSVTVVPPGPRAHAGTIATGTIDGQSWQVYRDKPKANGAPGQQCVAASGPAFGALTQPLQDCGAAQPVRSDPVDWQGLACDGYGQASFGAVRADVSYVLVKLSDGTELKLIPVKVYGLRYVAFASPASLSVASATAYLTDGQYLRAIPFNAQDGLPIFGAWQSPGGPIPARVTAKIAAGSDVGQTWAVRASTGPWGTCFVQSGPNAGLLGCVEQTGPMGTRMLVFCGDSPGMVAGSAAAGVRYLTITMTDGAALRVTPVAVGSQRYFAFYLDKGEQQVRRWTAYDAAGKRLSSGKLK